MPSESNKQLALAIIDFLRTSATDGTLVAENAEGLDVAAQCIAEAFEIDADDAAQRAELSIAPATLPTLFDVFRRTQARRKAAGVSDGDVASPPSKVERVEVSEEDKEAAEGFKKSGNAKMAAREYPEAVAFYDQAIGLNPTNAVYYANRAAAQSQAGNHTKAVADALKAAEVDPSYSKAYSRLGHGYFSLGKFEDAAAAYEKGLVLDKGNSTMMAALAAAKSKISSSSPVATREASPGASSSGAPPANPFGGGGMPDMASMLSNPQFMSMASQLMQNPEAMKMAQSMMGSGGGGMPDISEMMKNPAMMEMASKFMGGNNGGGQ